MIQQITTLVVSGILTATAATYLLDLNKAAEINAQDYAKAAQHRFEEYERMLPASVVWPSKEKR